MPRIAFSSPLYGEVRLKMYKFLQKRLKFDIWYTFSTIYSREYARWIVDNVNDLLKNEKKENGYVIELGCGLGEIIGNIDWHHKIGYDIDVRVIKAAKILSNGKFRVGSFKDVNLGEKR